MRTFVALDKDVVVESELLQQLVLLSDLSEWIPVDEEERDVLAQDPADADDRKNCRKYRDASKPYY